PDGTGAAMDETRPLPDAAADAADAFVPLWLVLQPSGTRVELARPEVVVGRHRDADIRLPLPDVSRRHCRFTFAAGGWQVEDLCSLNGVHVNGVPVRQAALRQGDLVRIGGFTFAVDLDGSAPAGPAGPLHAILQALPPRRLAS